MLLSSAFNSVCKFASQGSFPVSCYKSTQKILWHFKIRKNWRIQNKFQIDRIWILNLSIRWWTTLLYTNSIQTDEIMFTFDVAATLLVMNSSGMFLNCSLILLCTSCNTRPVTFCIHSVMRYCHKQLPTFRDKNSSAVQSNGNTFAALILHIK